MLVLWLCSQWVKYKNTIEEYGEFCLILSVSLAAVMEEQSQAHYLVSWLRSPLCSLLNLVWLAVYHIMLNGISLRKKVCSTSGLIILKSLLWSFENQLSKCIQFIGNACSFYPIQLWLLFCPNLPLLYLHSYHTAVVPSEKQFSVPVNKHLEHCSSKMFFNLHLCLLTRPNPKLLNLQSKICFRRCLHREGEMSDPGNRPAGPEGCLLHGVRSQWLGWMMDGFSPRLWQHLSVSVGPMFPRKREAATLCQESLLPLHRQ